jgi:predicted nucleic acid-binding protein
MRELLGDEDLDTITAGSAQDWFDQWKDQAVSLRDANSMAYMEENYPKTALMLEIMEGTKP